MKTTRKAILATLLLAFVTADDTASGDTKQIIDLKSGQETDPVQNKGFFLRGRNGSSKDVFVGFQQEPFTNVTPPQKRQFLEPGQGPAIVEASQGCGYGRPTVLAQVCGDMNLSYFCLALQTAGLDRRLQSTQDEYTVFVPTNAAMQQAGIPLDDLDYLQDLLLFHTSTTAMTKDELPCIAGDNLVEMATGDATRTLCLKGVPTYQKGQSNVEPPAFTDFDRMGCNGVVHVVDRVLLHQPLIGGL